MKDEFGLPIKAEVMFPGIDRHGKKDLLADSAKVIDLFVGDWNETRAGGCTAANVAVCANAGAFACLDLAASRRLERFASSSSARSLRWPLDVSTKKSRRTLLQRLYIIRRKRLKKSSANVRHLQERASGRVVMVEQDGVDTMLG